MFEDNYMLRMHICVCDIFFVHICVYMFVIFNRGELIRSVQLEHKRKRKREGGRERKWNSACPVF